MPASNSDSVVDARLVTIAGRQPVTADPCQEDVLILFNQCGASLLRYVGSFGLGVEETEDVVQEAFLLLFQHLRLSRPRTNLRGWLFQVAHNLALRHRRRKCDRPDCLITPELGGAATRQNLWPERWTAADKKYFRTDTPLPQATAALDDDDVVLDTAPPAFVLAQLTWRSR
jgi:DNA-directed RNA polymerase specialized sigma24 family protein